MGEGNGFWSWARAVFWAANSTTVHAWRESGKNYRSLCGVTYRDYFEWQVSIRDRGAKSTAEVFYAGTRRMCQTCPDLARDLIAANPAAHPGGETNGRV